jgi:hypothetical protein
MKISSSNFYLIISLLLGLILRLLFSFYFSKYYFGNVNYTIGDSYSYVNPILNLLKYGVYAFDIDELDSYFYRGPIYPFFWGIHYILFGENLVFESVAVSQSFIDVLSGYLIYKILGSFGVPTKYSLLGMLMYLINPILLVHVPITGTETLAIFITLFYFHLLVKSNNNLDFIKIGILAGICLLTRQYLGILMPIGILYIFLNSNLNIHKKTKNSIVIFLSFSLTLTPWFLRNYINWVKPIVLMGETTGYQAFQEDYIAFDKLYSLIYVDVTPIFQSVALVGKDTITNSNVLGSLSDELRELNEMAFKCGPSFNARRYNILYKKDNSLSNNCKSELITGYDKLRVKLLAKNGFFFKYKTAFLNLKKSFFKMDLTSRPSSVKDAFIYFSFSYRIFYVILGFLSILFIRGNKKVTIILFPVFMFFFVSVVIRHVEIRYLAQAEAILIILAAFSIFKIRSHPFFT